MSSVGLTPNYKTVALDASLEISLEWIYFKRGGQQAAYFTLLDNEELNAKGQHSLFTKDVRGICWKWIIKQISFHLPVLNPSWNRHLLSIFFTFVLSQNIVFNMQAPYINRIIIACNLHIHRCINAAVHCCCFSELVIHCQRQHLSSKAAILHIFTQK